ncbi:MAG: MarR family transcriptional regulator [Candidatus Aenigmarchaeota archaeon]|nr:MarR family transcriptional regulator [Candidatus Aenigmarchaeota archaeon]
MVTTKSIGFAVMVAAVVFFLIGFAYISSAEKALLAGHTLTDKGECVHAETEICPFQQINSLAVPKYVGLFSDIAFFLFGLALFLKKTPEEQALRKAGKVAKALGGDEAKAFGIITQSNGMIFQNELVEKLGLSKVKVTRILDKLEGKALVERRRRGMTNVIILK